ncbi:uncharacterized protein LOC104892146 isoform X2 [Beta vulgaris subsp. vulgaris]|uniref:uncharacterized protein LOC104892146 isoform X2 n=1 Tax=Beta vulgaris subsp. vulgaris TaxID=3555 RepID=UPI002036B89A|nr:uncharacterized protein LOC104892146 isoform X2 [Beta vulgaris subsp. vulgaris]
MATKPLTTEAIALTEKKMDMSLDDIIKMSSKTNVGKLKKPRASNKNSKTTNGQQDRSLKIRQYMNSRSTMRQGVLAQKRSNFQGKFPLASDAAARKAVVAPIRNGGFNRNRDVNWNRPRAAGQMRRQGNASIGGNALKPQHQQQRQQQPFQRGEMMSNQKPKTLDSRFANMKEQRMRAVTNTNNGGAVRGAINQPRQPWLRGRFGNYRS